MRTLIVYESVHGNTKSVAEAIACGIGGDTTLLEVDAAPREVDYDLLVIGAPTYGLGMSWPRNRAPGSIGVREWIPEMVVPSTTAVATFGTHVGNRRIATTASAQIARVLHQAGAPVVTQPVSFRLVGRRGPLRDDEWLRARRWGARLAAMVVPIVELAGHSPG